MEDVVKLATQVEDFPLVTDRIALANGTLYLDGTFQEGKPEIVRNRLPVRYDPKAPQPTHWLRFLSDLLYPEDIPTVHEFIGYCLIPSNNSGVFVHKMFSSDTVSSEMNFKISSKDRLLDIIAFKS